MTTTDPYTSLRSDLTGQPPLDEPVFPPGHPDAPPVVQAAPPGMVWTLLPDGSRALAYLPPGYEKTADGPPQAPKGWDKWPARMLAGGAGTSMVLGVIGHYGPGLSQAGHGAEMAGIGLGIATAGVGALLTVFKGMAGSKKAPVEVTLNVTNNVTSNSRSTSRSRSR